MRKMKPKSPKKARAIAPLAAEKRALANNRTSSIGSRRRTCQDAKQTRITAVPAKPPNVAGDAQPCLGASITVQMSSPAPAPKARPRAGQSARPGCHVTPAAARPRL